LSGAFGYASVQAAVDRASPADVRAEFHADVAAGLVEIKPSSQSPMIALPMSGPAPTIEMTPYEIYLEFRTAPVGSLGSGASLVETTKFMGSNIALAAGVGWEIGSQIYNLIQQYDPALDDAIGGTVAESINILNNDANAIGTAVNGYVRGLDEQMLDRQFGSPVSNSGDRYGDWGEMWDMGYGEGDGCF
jgi:hypothetical protein